MAWWRRRAGRRARAAAYGLAAPVQADGRVAGRGYGATVDRHRWSDLSRPPLRAAALRRALIGDEALMGSKALAPTGPRGVDSAPAPAQRPAAPAQRHASGRSTVWTSIEVVERTGSTNADLATRARAGAAAPGTVLVAEHQDAGRGRRDRSWQAPPRSSLTFSVLLAPSVPAARWSWIPLLAGSAVADALVAVAHVPAQLKWPNDVLIAERKVAGVLAEVVDRPAGPAVVVGIGLNVSQTRDELPVPDATSLVVAGAATADRDTVLRAVLRTLAGRYHSWVGADGDQRASGIGSAYRGRCQTLGRLVRVRLPDGATVTGTADGIDADGRLLVGETDGSVRSLAVADVEHVRFS
ncbi:MAG: biotin--[acetyl-CoA-carboxylase] ligase [Angustibacter sp.]